MLLLLGVMVWVEIVRAEGSGEVPVTGGSVRLRLGVELLGLVTVSHDRLQVVDMVSMATEKE